MQTWSLRSYLCLAENYILRYIMKIYGKPCKPGYYDHISVWPRTLRTVVSCFSSRVTWDRDRGEKLRIVQYISRIFYVFWYISIVMMIMMRDSFSPYCSLGLLVPSQNQKGQKKNLKSLKMLISNKSNQHHPHLLWFQVDLPRTRQVFYRLLSPCQEQS